MRILRSHSAGAVYVGKEKGERERFVGEIGKIANGFSEDVVCRVELDGISREGAVCIDSWVWEIVCNKDDDGMMA
jgi:hypothetical protein